MGTSVKKLNDLAPERRRVVMFLSPEDYRRALRDAELLESIDNPEVAVLSMDDLSDEDHVASRLRRANKARAGALLVQSPYDADHYEPADAALAEFAVAKFMLLSRV